MWVSRDNSCEHTSFQVLLECIVILGLLLMATPLMALANSNAMGGNPSNSHKNAPPVEAIQTAATAAKNG